MNKYFNEALLIIVVGSNTFVMTCPFNGVEGAKFSSFCFHKKSLCLHFRVTRSNLSFKFARYVLVVSLS